MQKLVDMPEVAGLVQVKERPTSGRYMQMWITKHEGPTIWSETIEVDDDGTHRQWSAVSDDFTEFPSEPLITKVVGEIVFFVNKGAIVE